jgi:chemotaxis protein histidine kinase CheA
MNNDHFAERMAGIRRRFAAKVQGRIGEVEAVLPRLTGSGPEVAGTLADAHRRVHDLCGVGATLGFVATGQAARVVEQLLLGAARAQRGLTREELTRVQQGLAFLRQAAENDVQAARAGTE